MQRTGNTARHAKTKFRRIAGAGRDGALVTRAYRVPQGVVVKYLACRLSRNDRYSTVLPCSRSLASSVPAENTGRPAASVAVNSSQA